MLLLGDCLEQMKTLPDNSVDACVCDPPYGLSFMGKRWDYDVPSVDIWREVFRVLKPGGHVLSFGGTRTYHRMVVNIEDAGFEIRDQVQWIYGSGFPKSHNVSKAIDKMAGAEREVVGLNPSSRPNSKMKGSLGFDNWLKSDESAGEQYITAPATPEAKQWDGWGSALKPANEPICLARKPLEKGLTLAENVLKYGTGAMNIDGTRIENSGKSTMRPLGKSAYQKGSGMVNGGTPGMREVESEFGGGHEGGRWPANVLFDEDAAQMLDAQSGHLKPSGSTQAGNPINGGHRGIFGGAKKPNQMGHNDSGGASRFFYVAKASKRERNAGLEGMPEKTAGVMDDDSYVWAKNGDGSERNKKVAPRANFHPTVKPLKLMEYLITLITPKNGIVLDPFMGSGSTGVAAKNLNRNFIGCEMSPEYFEIAKKRIEHVTEKQQLEIEV